MTEIPALTTGEEFETVLARIPGATGRFPLLSEMFVEQGTKADWDLLHDLHYKAEGALIGPHYWRCTLRGETIGVCVISVARGMLSDRHKAFPNLACGKDTKISNTFRFNIVNRDFRNVSRLVVDTMYRGCGVAYRMQNLASRMEGFKYIEIQSSMSKYNFFAEKAGFRFIKPRRANKYEIGLQHFRRFFKSYPGDHEGIMQEYAAMSPAIQTKVVSELKHFYYLNSAVERTGANNKNGKKRVDEMSFSELIRALIQMCFSSPLYGVYRNPDYGREIPKRLPLIAFDWQGVNEPLNMEKYRAGGFE
jgi:ABC-type ATPase with predicted acetyltransferase domain